MLVPSLPLSNPTEILEKRKKKRGNRGKRNAAAGTEVISFGSRREFASRDLAVLHPGEDHLLGSTPRWFSDQND